MIATDVTGTFLVPLKVTLMAAFLIALPYVLYQMWAFVAPGLYRHEKRLALPVIMSSVVFFALGMCFAYFVVFPIAFGFFAGYAPTGVQMMTDIDKYLSFVLTMFIAFGITFETPVVVIVLVRLGVVSLEKLRAIRGYVIVGAFVVGAVFTPPDILSQLMMAVPLWLLYELGPAGGALHLRSEARRRCGRRGKVAPDKAFARSRYDARGFGRLPTVTSMSTCFCSRITLSLA